MKKIHFLIGLLTLFIAGLGIYSCQRDKENDNQKTNTITAKSMEFVGIEHNKLLDESFEFLKKEYQENGVAGKTISDRKEILQSFLISKFENNSKYSKESNDLAIKNIQQIFNSNYVSDTSLKKINPFSVKIPKEIVSYLEELDQILNYINSDKDIEKQIHQLEKRIENNDKLTSQHLIILFSSTQTAKFSYKYWKENSYKWENLNPNRNNITLRSLKLSTYVNSESNNCFCNHAKDIVKYDVAGAVGGAAGAAIVNVVPGWGQVAYGSAIVGGAAAASVTEGVKKLLDWIW